MLNADYSETCLGLLRNHSGTFSGSSRQLLCLFPALFSSLPFINAKLSSPFAGVRKAQGFYHAESGCSMWFLLYREWTDLRDRALVRKLSHRGSFDFKVHEPF